MAMVRTSLSLDYCQMAKIVKRAVAKKASAPKTRVVPRPKLKAARQAAELSLERLSDTVEISVAQLSRFESGQRDPRDTELRRIAEALGVPVAALMDAPVRTVPLVGYVGAGAEAVLFGEGQGENDEVEAPEGATDDTVAVEIRGESLGELFDRWLVFYDDVRRPLGADMMGKLCVVGLTDGRILVKKVRKGQLDGRFNLLSNTEPPIYDAEIEWAAKVRQMMPR